MNSVTPIVCLSRDEIDTRKWDRCVEQAANGLIYAFSFYLDAMADDWEGLVAGDYEAVMPLPCRKKFGIAYLYQPFLTAQLGVFGKTISSSLVRQFLDAIPKKFRYWDIYINAGSFFPLERYPSYPRVNYVLDLRPPYAQLSDRFRENITRNIRKARQQGCFGKRGIPAEDVIGLAMAQINRHSPAPAENVERFRRLYSLLEDRQMAGTYGIFLPGGELVSSAVFFYSHQRAYYILVGNHPNGRTIGASHSLIDDFIRDHAGQELVLDFEGSDLRNLAFFYSSFGATEEKFAGLRINRLPFYLKWLKG